MKIQVLGSGCPTCKKLYEITQKAVEEAGLKEEVEYLTGQEGIQKIMEMGVMGSPVLAVDGKPVLTGFVDDVENGKFELTKKSDVVGQKDSLLPSRPIWLPLIDLFSNRKLEIDLTLLDIKTYFTNLNYKPQFVYPS